MSDSLYHLDPTVFIRDTIQHFQLFRKGMQGLMRLCRSYYQPFFGGRGEENEISHNHGDLCIWDRGERATANTWAFLEVSGGWRAC